MQIQNNYSVNFNGGFRLKGLTPELKELTVTSIPKHRQIFENFEKQNDMFILCRDISDYGVNKFARANNIELEYYPQINTKSGFDSEEPEILSKKLKRLMPVISKTQINKIISEKIRMHKVRKFADYSINNILSALCMEAEGKEISMVKGAHVIKDKEFARKVIISPLSNAKVHYVSVIPDSANEEIKRYAFDTRGNIVSTYQTPDGIKTFNKAFNETLITKA